jgi:hypothetical protein
MRTLVLKFEAAGISEIWQMAIKMLSISQLFPKAIMSHLFRLPSLLIRFLFVAHFTMMSVMTDAVASNDGKIGE